MNIGNRIGKLTVIEQIDKYTWKLQCDCGDIVERKEENLKTTVQRGGSPICSKCHHKSLRPPVNPPKHLDIAGQTFGHLTAIEPTGQSDKRRYSIWRFRCICGDVIEKSTGFVGDKRKGRTYSCGKPACNGHVKLPPGQSAINYFFGQYKRNAKNRHIDFLLTKNEFAELIQKDCFYCGEHPRKLPEKITSKSFFGDFSANGIDRIDNTKGYTIENSVPCCGMCNWAKKDRSLEDFARWILNLKTNFPY